MALQNSAANTTKYQAGGSGDNIVPDGFIKTVEKVWVDTITYSSTLTIGIGAIFDIAVIPKGKKITGISVHGVLGQELSATSTNSMTIGARYANGVTNGVQFLSAMTFGTLLPGFILQPLEVGTGIGVELTSSTHTIFLHFLAASASITAGTIRTIVKYT